MSEPENPDDPNDLSDPEHKPEKASDIFPLAIGFLIVILSLGAIWKSLAPYKSPLYIMAEMEERLNCRTSELSGVILCVSNVNNLQGVLLNTNEEAVFVIKEVDSASGLFGFLGAEWNQELPAGELFDDALANYHMYHIFKGGKYQGVLTPLWQEHLCPKDPHCV
jgi:hypothetical protein